MITEIDMRTEMRMATRRLGSACAFAVGAGLSRSQVSKMLNGQIPITEAAAQALGYVRVTRFIKVEDARNG